MHVLNEVMVACLNKGWLNIYEPFICPENILKLTMISEYPACLECIRKNSYQSAQDTIMYNNENELIQNTKSECNTIDAYGSR